jgi:hypothetical protein
LTYPFQVNEKPIFSFQPCGKLAHERKSIGLAEGSAVSQGQHHPDGKSLIACKEGHTVVGLLPRLRIAWRQLPMIIVSGLLIGVIFGEAIKAFAPERTTTVARMKSRP